jgi:malonyl-CoA/methylmalonyl-CoA synthetase
MTNLYDLFQDRFQSGTDFILSPDNKVLASYEDLDCKSAQYANCLIDLGLSRGDRVIVQVEKSIECLYLYFACLRAGLIYLPLNTAYQKHELEYFINDATPELIICSPDNEELYKSLSTGKSTSKIFTLDESSTGSLSKNCEGLPTLFQSAQCDASDIAAILYTSGTTGRPKGAMISHGNLIENSLALHKAWGWVPGDIMLHALPIFHIHGLFVATHLAVLNASPIIFLKNFAADEVIRLLPSATVYMGVPTNYTRLLANSDLNQAACQNMRLFTAGSAPLLPQTFAEFESRTGHTIVERYGMTETGMNTSNPLEGIRKAGTVGPPLPDVSCKVVDNKGTEVGTGETGNLLVKGGNVFKGYWQMPEKTKEEFTEDGYFKTGDLASCDEDGYISIVGRNKDMIITGGLNVYPREIEECIDKLDGVQESAVIGLSDDDFGEAVTAIVVLTKDSNLDAQSITAYLKDTVANFKVARKVYFLDELPRNTMGKVQKNLLREMYKPEP